MDSIQDKLDKAKTSESCLKVAESFEAYLKARQLKRRLEAELRGAPFLKSLGITTDLLEKGAASLLGREVSGVGELAGMAQIYRDPRYETFRYLFTQKNIIVGHAALSCRLPARVAVFPGVSDEEGLVWLRDQLQGHKADGYYALHNHPNGDPTPSSKDIESTSKIKKVVGFRGHGALPQRPSNVAK